MSDLTPLLRDIARASLLDDREAFQAAYWRLEVEAARTLRDAWRMRPSGGGSAVAGGGDG